MTHTDREGMGASSPSAPTGLSSLRDGAATRLHPDGPQSAGAQDAATALLRSVRGRFASFDGFQLEEIRSRRWNSVTFSGARHELTFKLEGRYAEEAATQFLSGLYARDFTLPGHLLADLALVSEERRPGSARIRLEALTVEEL